ncbi:hypothetical protein GCM10022226_30350 [Sphaerisporangium flaviroseum]|uniref:Uncharacterized protein n=1 Tax=Sphaerisporangium flaviroseum TaxID=509199 RepID=A0ABP7I5X2_9ACTN
MRLPYGAGSNTDAEGAGGGGGGGGGISGHAGGFSGHAGGRVGWLVCSGAIAGEPPDIMPGLGVLGMISCEAGVSAGESEKAPRNCRPVGSVGGSCIGRPWTADSGLGSGSYEFTTAKRLN